MLNEKQLAGLRKAYHSASLDKWLNEFLAAGEMNEEASKEIYAFLEVLEAEKNETLAQFTIFNVKESVNLPGVSELMDLTGSQKQALEKWGEAREADYQKAKEIFTQARKNELRINTNQYLNWGFELAGIQFDLDLYRVWKDQLYHARLVDIMDSHGISRSEAEERAKLTPEYRDYKKAVLFRELVEEVIMLCKKRYSNT